MHRAFLKAKLDREIPSPATGLEKSEEKNQTKRQRQMDHMDRMDRMEWMLPLCFAG